MIGRRLGRLSEATSRVLGLAAVIGRQFDVALLAKIAEASEDAVLDALDEATAAALVSEVRGSAEQFTFRHALIRSDALRGAERAAPGAAAPAGRARRSRRSSARRPARASRSWPITGSRRPARPTSGRRSATRARRASGRSPTSPSRRRRRTSSGRSACSSRGTRTASGCGATCCSRSAMRSAGRATPATARRWRTRPRWRARSATASASPSRRSRAPAPAGSWRAPTSSTKALIALYEEASGALGDADSLLRARVLGQLAVELVYTPHRERRDALTREAVAMARRLGDRTGLAQVLILRLIAMNDPFTLAERLALTGGADGVGG